MRTVILLLLGVHLAYAGTHSLKYFYTAVSGDIDFPEFTIVGLVDEGQFMYFDSNTMKVVPKTEWMRQKEGADCWDSQTQTATGTHQAFRNNIQVAKERFNHSTGVHTFQFMYGCELDDDGSTRGSWQIGYDGEDFITLDKRTLTWTAANPQAVITKHKWEALAVAEQNKGYLENTCIEWLKKYVAYGKDTLERKVSPQVSLLQKDPSSPVTCHATGFYPSGVKISWQKNGQDHHEDVDLGELLPNADGTFQKTSTLRVTPDEWKKNEFKCVVEHQGKTKIEDEIRTNGGDSVSIGIIIGALAAVVLLIVIGAAGYVVYKKKQGFKPVSGSDDGSNSSAQAVPRA
uniref:MHC class I antigen n=1 Tax=Megalobrama amblycephala TaxID=75352 RepID=F6JYB1_MEGAM|nr:MHC class I antigen [Megalobrama amblycephala]